ncbi:MAG TPA: MogA/MoaB family molybdenum cofactor biosynthesis protein [Desulfoprunum sp.]|jgi:molybdenum cofactor synthesis domain-containing protein|nr:MogA/MoaB family molybdenum cofactor biosynthesis protein [Desulfoprunum sp.]
MKNNGHDRQPEGEVALPAYSFAVLTMSDKGSRGEREDTSGPYLVERLQREGYVLQSHAIIPDRVAVIVDALIALADRQNVDLIVTTGGTGVAPTDVTPEAMLQVIDKEVPGMAEAMRAESLRKTPHAMLSRGKVGIRGRTLIVNLPGSLKAARENIEVVLPVLPHALEKIGGGTADCAG